VPLLKVQLNIGDVKLHMKDQPNKEPVVLQYYHFKHTFQHIYKQYYLHFRGRFPSKPGLVSSPSVSTSTYSGKQHSRQVTQVFCGSYDLPIIQPTALHMLLSSQCNVRLTQTFNFNSVTLTATANTTCLTSKKGIHRK